MDAKLNLYDFLAYIIPGTLIAVLLYWLCTGFLAFPVSPTTGTSDAVMAILFLSVSYFLGHIVQSAGARYEQRKAEKEGGWFSEKFLQVGDTHYTTDYKRQLEEAMRLEFHLNEQVPRTCQKTLAHHPPEACQKDADTCRCRKEDQQELFSLCNALLRQNVETNNAEVLRSICALYRGLYIIMYMGVLISSLILLKQIVLLCFQGKQILPQDGFFVFQELHLELGVIFLIFFGWSIFWLKKRWRQYSEYYVDSVYSNFYSWYCEKYHGQPGEKAAQEPVASSQTPAEKVAQGPALSSQASA